MIELALAAMIAVAPLGGVAGPAAGVPATLRASTLSMPARVYDPPAVVTDQGGHVLVAVPRRIGPLPVTSPVLTGDGEKSPIPWESSRFFATGDHHTAFVAVPYRTPVGTYEGRLAARWDGLPVLLTVRLNVTHRPFTTSRLTVSSRTSALLTDPQRARDAADVAEAKSRTADRPLWSGPFLWPAKGTFTTGYGHIRYVNGRENGRHSGIDIAGPAGTPIVSPADGTVVLAKELVVTGLTVIIDHGANVFSTLAHLSRIDVEPGQSVRHGEKVGAMGATGFVTGSHLHWTLSIGATPTDPEPFTRRDVLAGTR